jgi:lactate permease
LYHCFNSLLEKLETKKIFGGLLTSQHLLLVADRAALTFGKVLKAWSPFIILTVMVILWGLKPVVAAIDAVSIKWLVPGLDKLVMQVAPIAKQPTALAALYKINWLSAAGTSLFIAAIITAAVLGVSPARFILHLCKNIQTVN